jgi:hypothetical protein
MGGRGDEKKDAGIPTFYPLSTIHYPLSTIHYPLPSTPYPATDKFSGRHTFVPPKPQ